MYGLTPFERNFFDSVNDFDKAFAKSGVRACRTDIREDDDKFIMESELPGFDKEDITVDLNGNSLTLKAEHKAETEESKKGKYIRRERSYGSYERTFDIAGIDTENITADYKNGILTMVLPKKKPQAPATRKLTIN